MKYELRIRQWYDIDLNDEDLNTYLIPQPPESYDPQGYDQWNETVGTLVMIIRYKTDVGDLDGAIFYEDLLDNDVYESFIHILHPAFILNPEAIKFGYTTKFEEDIT